MLTTKEPYIALFVAPTGVGKTHLALDLLVCVCVTEREISKILISSLLFAPLCNTMRHTTSGSGFGLILTSFR